MIQKIDFETARAVLDANENAVLLDVRTEEEYEWEHAVGAKLLCMDAIDADSAQAVIPSYSSFVVVYCRSGNRSALAAKRLARLGYENLYDIGGLNGWPYGTTTGLDG